MRRRLTLLIVVTIALVGAAIGNSGPAKAEERCFWVDLPPIPAFRVCLPV